MLFFKQDATRMRRIICYSFFIFQAIIGQAQTFSVSSFKLLDTDLTANTDGTMEIDQNGETAALIKVVTTQTGFTFDGGALGIVKTVQKPSEIWVYVPRGLKKISISHPQLGMLRDYYLNVPIEAARTYEMILISGQVQTTIKQTSNNQYLVINVSPTDAIVELDNEVIPTSNGIAQKFVKLGTYDYRVQAHDYHTAAGKVTVDDINNKKILDIKLQPAFGWIEFPSNEEYNEAQVFIDNTLVGTIPMKSKNLPSGLYNIRIVKDLYYPFSQNVIVKDNETTIVTPSLLANFSDVSINVDNGADIYINEVKKGTGVWKGRLSPGNYSIEAKKNGYLSSSQSIEITKNHKIMNIQLPSPTPVYGDANITSTPPMSDVYVDDSLMGKTPLYIPQILIGKHKLFIKNDGYSDFKDTIVIYENNNTSLNAELLDLGMCKVRIRCNVPDALLFVDNEEIGEVAELKKIEPGEHNIKVMAEGFMDYNNKINIDKDSINDFYLKLKPDKYYLKNNSLTWQRIRITSDTTAVLGMTIIGDVSGRFAYHGDNPTMYEDKKQRCLVRMKKKAAKMGGRIILTKSLQESQKYGNYTKIFATVYK